MPRESKREKLKQLKKEEEELKLECDSLTKGSDAKESCKEIIKFIESKEFDGFSMQARETNPFCQRQNNCFVKGTKILLNKETMKTTNIENMKIGDIVTSIILTKNETNGKFEKKYCHGTVYYTMKSKEYDTCTMLLSDNTTIECTLQHPFFVCNQGWKTVSGGDLMSKEEKRLHGYDKDETMKSIGKLEIGDKFYCQNGKMATIEEMHLNHYSDGIDVYNMSVDNGHTYFANGILVHNKCVIL